MGRPPCAPTRRPASYNPPMAIDLKTIRKLSVQKRLELVERIWESIDTEAQPFTDKQRAEIQRRLQHYHENPKSALTYDQIKAKLRSVA
jgi:putative addiction module component (TIGR02574 family)